MKWVTLLKDIKEKVGLTPSHSAGSAPSASASSSSSSSILASSARDNHVPYSVRRPDSASSPARSTSNLYFFLNLICPLAVEASHWFHFFDVGYFLYLFPGFWMGIMN